LDGGFVEEMGWLDHWLKGGQTGVRDEPAMTYYRMGAARKGAASDWNGFRHADTWPPAEAVDTRIYLHGAGGVSTARPTSWTDKITYAFDPASPVPTHGGANYNNFPDDYPITVGPVDLRVIPQREDYLRFASDPLEEPLTIQGRVEAELWVSTDAPDTDFMVKLVDIYPDG